MMTVPHAVAGAALGSMIGDHTGSVVIAFTVGIASHYVLDAFPHWERIYKPAGDINFDTTDAAHEWPRHIFVQAALDVIAAAFIVWGIISFLTPGDLLVGSNIFWGAFGAVLPDLIDNVPFWNTRLQKTKLFAATAKFHNRIHICEDWPKKYPFVTGLLTQLIVIGGSLWILFSR